MFQIMHREFILIFKNRPEVLLVLIGAATAYALLIGNLYSGRILQNIPVAVCNLDETNLSRELVKNISEADQFVLIKNISSEIEATEILERSEVAAVFVIPENFSKNFYSQNAVKIALLADGANIIPVNYLSTPANLIIGNFAAKYNIQAALANSTPTLSPAPVTMSLRLIGNTVQGYLEFYIYGVMLMAAHAGITLAFGFSIFDDKENPALIKEFGFTKVLIAKEIFYLALSLFSVVIGINFLAVCFEMPFQGAIWQMILICGAFLFAAENMAGVLAMIFKTRLSFAQCIIFYTLPAILTAGYIWAELGMTTAIKILSAIQPVHYALADFRRISLTGADVTLWQNFGILMGLGIIFYVALNFIERKYIP